MQYSQACRSTAAGRRAGPIPDNSGRGAGSLRIADGDKQALQTLFARHNVRVFRFVLRFVNDEAAAEDLVSEVFLDVWRQADRFEAPLAGLDLADGDRPQQGALGAASRAGPKSSTKKSPSSSRIRRTIPRSRCRSRQRTEILRKCLTQLSPAHREIIDLVYYHEKSIDEVAEIIGVPQNTVKTRMFYARKRIGEIMMAEGIERAWL